MLGAALVIILIIIGLILFTRKNPLDEIPGPKGIPILGNVLQLRSKKPFLAFADMAKKYGNIYKLRFPGTSFVLVNDPELIYKMFVSKGADFAGRPLSFRLLLFTNNNSDVALTDAGPPQKARRKLVHSFLKQYAAGIQKIEDITQSAIEDLIRRIKQDNHGPLAIESYITRFVTDIMGILVTGDTLSEDDLQDVTTYIDLTTKAFEFGGDGDLLDIFPFLRYLGNKSYKFLTRALQLERSYIDKWIKQKPIQGFIAYLEAISAEEQKKYHVLQQKEKVGTISDLFGAGVSTTAATLTNLVYVLAHHPEVQKKLQEEICEVVGESRHTSIMDKENMPYHQATLFEIGRFTSLAPIAVPHKAIRGSTLGGYSIPAGTQIFANLWAMHHDDKLWDKPFDFQPERFLDTDGHIIPADHPNRRHLMPFGAGPRGCIGETMALTRMFLVLSRFMQEFTLLTEHTSKLSMIDPRNMESGATLSYPPFKVKILEFV